MKLYLPAIFVLSILSGCANIFEPPSVKVESKKQSFFTSVGYAPIELQPGDSFDLKMLNAIKASKLEAYKEMAEQIHGVLITSGNDVEGTVLLDDRIESQVKGLVRGARILKSYHEGGVYITELEFDMQTLLFLEENESNKQAGKAIKVKPVVYY
jgi:outer membrane protein FlgP